MWRPARREVAFGATALAGNARAASADAPALSAIAAAPIHRAWGANASAKPPIARPAAPPSWKPKPFNARYRPSRPGRERSAMSAFCTVPWKHSPNPNTVSASANTAVAAEPENHQPPANTMSQAEAHTVPSTA